MQRKLQRWVADLNRLLRAERALHERDFSPSGFAWIDCNDADASIISFLRRGAADGDQVAVVANFTPVPRSAYRIGVPHGGFWQELLNSDSDIYGGSGIGNLGGVEAEPIPFHGQPFSVSLTLPPLSILFLGTRSPSAASQGASR